MSWLKNIFSPKSPVPANLDSTAETRHGLPVYEKEIRGEKLERRDVFILQNNVQTKIPIAELRSQFHSGKILGDAPVLVTNFYCGQT